MTLTGRVQKKSDENLARRFLARHPGARKYAGFADFGFYRMTVERAHFVGGFGRATWFGAARYVFEKEISKTVGGAEKRLIERLDRKKIQASARRLFGGTARAWQIIGVDLEGCDFRCRNTFRRLTFEKPARSVQGIRAALVDIL